MEKTPLNRQQMAARLAQEFEEGWVVNLGIGIPTLCSNYADDVILHAENGVIGYGALLPKGEEDLHLVNAGGQHVSLKPGASIVHHADSFVIVRGGHIDVTVMGSYEVSEKGDFANWRTSGRKGGGIGGAMDLAMGAKRVFIAMEHTTRDGSPRLLKELNLPATARGVVIVLMTNLGLIDITPEGFCLREIAPGYSPEEVQEMTDAKLAVSPALKEIVI
ncbi:MAG: 3-oxoacid CoA-transferase subunit B [Chloroflexi bacterium]|nr:3-oxoacid CoA-transferase subunit B [Chloroflexota bacterium]